MHRKLQILTWAATGLSLIGVVLCAALPWYSVSLDTQSPSISVQSDSETEDADIYIWTSDSSFSAGWSAWFLLASFLVGAFGSHMFARKPKLNGIVIGAIGTLILATVAISLMPSTGGLAIPGLRIQRAATPFLAAVVAILLIFAAIELTRTSRRLDGADDEATDA